MDPADVAGAVDAEIIVGGKQIAADDLAHVGVSPHRKNSIGL